MIDYCLYDFYDLIEVICKEEIAQLEKENDEDIDEIDLENVLFTKFGINFENFCELIITLLPLCDKSMSEVTDIVYSGFGIGNTWIVRKKVE